MMKWLFYLTKNGYCRNLRKNILVGNLKVEYKIKVNSVTKIINSIFFLTQLSSLFQFVTYRDSLDWKNYGIDSIINTVINHKHLGNGSIVLMHNGATYTKDALETLIKGLKEKGYELVPISELIHTGDYHMDHEGRQFTN